MIDWIQSTHKLCYLGRCRLFPPNVLPWSRSTVATQCFTLATVDWFHCMFYLGRGRLVPPRAGVEVQGRQRRLLHVHRRLGRLHAPHVRLHDWRHDLYMTPLSVHHHGLVHVHHRLHGRVLIRRRSGRGRPHAGVDGGQVYSPVDGGRGLVGDGSLGGRAGVVVDDGADRRGVGRCLVDDRPGRGRLAPSCVCK